MLGRECRKPGAGRVRRRARERGSQGLSSPPRVFASCPHPFGHSVSPRLQHIDPRTATFDGRAMLVVSAEAAPPRLNSKRGSDVSPSPTVLLNLTETRGCGRGRDVCSGSGSRLDGTQNGLDETASSFISLPSAATPNSNGLCPQRAPLSLQTRAGSAPAPLSASLSLWPCLCPAGRRPSAWSGRTLLVL